MEFWDIIGLIVGAGAMTAIINQLGVLLVNRLQRKDVKDDKKADTEEKQQKFFTETSQRLSALEEAVAHLTLEQETLSVMQTAQYNAQKALLSERLFHLCQQYLKEKEIHYEELQRLRVLKAAYEGLNGTSDFSDVFERVEQLPLAMD